MKITVVIDLDIFKPTGALVTKFLLFFTSSSDAQDQSSSDRRDGSC